MRRPRGPGGRFLTADEIAAQKLAVTDHPSPSHPDNDQDMDDDDPVDISAPSARVDHEPFTTQNSDPMATIYHLQPHHHLAMPHTHPSQTLPQSPPPPPTKPISAHNNMYSHHHHNTTSPYPRPQMHHVPHPHAHARAQHSSIDYSHAHRLYNDSNPDINAADIQRRTDEIIQFGAVEGT